MCDTCRQESELQDRDVSVSAIAMGLLAVGTLLTFMAEFSASGFESSVVGLIALVLGAYVWAVAASRPCAARWLLLLGTQGVVLLGAAWLRNPLMVGLLALPPAMATVARRPFVAAALGMLDSLLLPQIIGLVGLRQDPFNVSLGLAIIWGAPALVWATNGKLAEQAVWLEAHYEESRLTLQNARQHELELCRLREDWQNALRQLALANERLAALRAAAEEARRSKAAFVASVSHEFRTPLNIIIGMVNLMVEAPEIYDGEFPPHAMEQLRTVYANCQHLTAMIDDVLDLSRVEAGRLTLHKEPVELGEVVRDSLNAVRPLIVEKGLRLGISVAEGLPFVLCDRTRIRQILLNLVSNAARLTEEGGVDVIVRRDDHHVQITVSDTGPGIADDDAERIFEPFRQGASSTWRARGGSGLGLSLSRTFVQLHGGRMWFESALGKGTSFTVELPISEASGHVSRPDRWIKQDWPWLEQSFRTEQVGREDGQAKPRILVCDEGGGLAQELSRHADDMQLVVVDSVPSAVEELARCPAHCAIVNAGSPDAILPMVEQARDGIQATPIVGCFCPPRASRARAAGAMDYLVKPVLCRDLAEAIVAAPRPVRRVLIVDDEHAARDLLRSYMRTIDNAIEVIEASCGHEAVDRMRDARPDLVVLDVVLPDIDGWQVLGIKDADPAIRDMPTIMVSAQDARDGPATTPVLVATQGRGLAISQLLACSQHLSEVLLHPG